jgi:hypothetical protein
MNMHRWKLACLILAGVAFGAFLSNHIGLPRAQAQGDGRAGNVVVVVGQESASDLPIILMDASEQTLLIYIYDIGSEDLELMAARTFRFDRLLTQFNNDGVTVDDVRRELQRAE